MVGDITDKKSSLSLRLDNEALVSCNMPGSGYDGYLATDAVLPIDQVHYTELHEGHDKLGLVAKAVWILDNIFPGQARDKVTRIGKRRMGFSILLREIPSCVISM